MVGLFISLALLGLAAFDPVGITAISVLLLQKHPFRRSLTFLGGSLLSLIIMGLLFARGFGAIVLRFENSSPWFVPSVEVVAGIVLLTIAGTMIWRMKMGKLSVEPSDFIVNRLQLREWKLFIFATLLVAFQSLFDVVFVIAMIHVGQLHLQVITLSAAIVTYAVTALVYQLAVITAFKLTSPKKRTKTLDRVHSMLIKYSYRAVIAISLLLGCGLLVLAA